MDEFLMKDFTSFVRQIQKSGKCAKRSFDRCEAEDFFKDTFSFANSHIVLKWRYTNEKEATLRKIYAGRAENRGRENEGGKNPWVTSCENGRSIIKDIFHVTLFASLYTFLQYRIHREDTVDISRKRVAKFQKLTRIHTTCKARSFPSEIDSKIDRRSEDRTEKHWRVCNTVITMIKTEYEMREGGEGKAEREDEEEEADINFHEYVFYLFFIPQIYSKNCTLARIRNIATKDINLYESRAIFTKPTNDKVTTKSNLQASVRNECKNELDVMSD
ncbi:hypothetical protein WN51_13303 [Melipona quadrifasciata]|uniref:Uncharacterized protein n=1 Tax=Melipona quadrifasciata TaxID=166423 RepID=A0A0N0BGT7_9HYME|nr:hypothetical protein WN51_13303 [Melipona quadrifasciata]